MNKEDEKILDEMDKELQEKHELLKESEWICVFCEEIFKGTPGGIMNGIDPLCADCYKILNRPPPYTFEVNNRVYTVGEKKI